MNDQQTNKGFGVSASPFNRVKLELGIVLCVGVILWLAADSITADIGAQLLLLGIYGLASMAWIIFSTRRIVRRYAERESPQHPEGP